MIIRNFAMRSPRTLLVCGALAACTADAVTAHPDATPPGSTPDTVGQGGPALPLFSGDVLLYERVSPSASMIGTRFVLFPDGAFSVESLRNDGTSTPTYSAHRGYTVYAGSLRQFGFIIGSDEPRDWGADAVVRGDSLIADYNDAMQLAGFEDGVYVRPPASPTTGEQIYVGSAAGSGSALPLARGGWPAWSPDGRRIAFHRDGQICLIDYDGANESCIGAGSFPTWSRNGTRIAFVNAEGIAVMNTDGSDVRTLVRHGFRTDTYAPQDLGVTEPAWSPDGESIAFEHLGDADTKPAQLFVMKSDGSGVRTLTEPINGARYVEGDPVWAPNGAGILFVHLTLGIARVQPSGGVPVSLYRNFPADAFPSKPSPSPDGLTVAYSLRDRITGGRSIWITGYGQTNPVGYDPAWSPDGKWIAYVRGQ
jgi:dipeptidyl aminopeptidase/acylaminoacyl peptidase